MLAVAPPEFLGVTRGDIVEWKRTPTTTGVSLRAATSSSHLSLCSLITQSATILGAVVSSSAITAAAGTNIGDKRYNNILGLQGRMQPVFIGQLMEKIWNQGGCNLDNNVTEVTAGPTETSTRLQPCNNYQIVSIPKTQPLVSGWASLENPDFQDDSTFSSSPASPLPRGSDVRHPSTLLFALLISTQATQKSAPQFMDNERGLDLATPIGIEFNVLYVRSCPGDAQVVNGYERIGMGKLFGEHAKRGFDLATERQVQLV